MGKTLDFYTIPPGRKTMARPRSPPPVGARRLVPCAEPPRCYLDRFDRLGGHRWGKGEKFTKMGKIAIQKSGVDRFRMEKGDSTLADKEGRKTYKEMDLTSENGLIYPTKPESN